MTGSEIEPELAELAAAHGVATSYVGADDRAMTVARDTVVAVLAALDVDAGTAAAIRVALADAREAPWRRLLPPTVVARSGSAADVVVRAPVDAAPQLTAKWEDGGSRELAFSSRPRETRVVDGARLRAWSVRLPADLPTGWHRLVATAGDRSEDATFVVPPAGSGPPPGLDRQRWGWTVQLYGVRSAGSWGIGDLADLAELARWSAGELGAAAVLCNPLNAVSPGVPVEDSPYFPSSRRFWNPLHLRIEDMAEYRTADAATRAAVDALRLPAHSDRIDRDAVWTAKSAAWELMWRRARDASRRIEQFRRERGSELEDFARFCALAEVHGRAWQGWPVELHNPRSPAVVHAAAELADRVAFHAWLQLACSEQLAAAQATARGAGMPVGIIHDLPIGADPGGADAWALQEVIAKGVTIGAPGDSFAADGQSWGLPPWRPDRLGAVGYAPYRDLLRSVLPYAGGIRVDHVPGLFRQWWVPAGEPASHGTYVGYDDRALLGVLALEAARAGALVIGEDLGTVEPRVRSALAEHGMLGSDVLWFQRAADGAPLAPERWRELAAASVSTHDLPTATGFLADGPAADRDSLLAALRSWGLLAYGAELEAEVVTAMHRLLRRTPCRLLLAALADAVGDRRQPNRPGTTTEYPNWQLPLAGPGSRPLSLEDLRADPGVRRLAQALSGSAHPLSVRSPGDEPAGS